MDAAKQQPSQSALESAQLFRSLATPTFITSPPKKGKSKTLVSNNNSKEAASKIMQEAAAMGILDSFENMDQWLIKEEPSKRVKKKSDISLNTQSLANTSPQSNSNANLTECIAAVKKFIVNIPMMDLAIPPFSPTVPSNEKRAVKATSNSMIQESITPQYPLHTSALITTSCNSLIDEMKKIDVKDVPAWRRFLDSLLKRRSTTVAASATPLVLDILTVWIAEHLITLSMTREQLALRQIAFTHARKPNFQTSSNQPLSYTTKDELLIQLQKLLQKL